MWWWKSEPKLDLDPELAEYAKKAVVPVVATPDEKAAPTRKRQFATNDKSKTDHQVAMDNCVEYERAYSNCLRSGSYMDRFGSCQTQKQMHDKCVELQTQALQVLDYARADDIAAKAAIKAKADDIMIETIPKLIITEEQVEKFKQKLESI